MAGYAQAELIRLPPELIRPLLSLSGCLLSLSGHFREAGYAQLQKSSDCRTQITFRKWRILFKNSLQRQTYDGKYGIIDYLSLSGHAVWLDTLSPQWLDTLEYRNQKFGYA